jgi:hypothetical protein
VRRDGSVTDADQVPGYLFAPSRSEGHNAAVFDVDCPARGRFALRVVRVASDAELSVFVDDTLALRKDLPAQNVLGKACTYFEQWRMWECRYDETFGVDVPAGRHRIRVEDTKPGFSWLQADGYLLWNYQAPTVRVLGLRGRDTILLWAQNRASTWPNADLGFTPATIRDATVRLREVPPGRWRVEWWDTWAGRRLSSGTVQARGGAITLPAPPIRRDIACRLTLIRG